MVAYTPSPASMDGLNSKESLQPTITMEAAIKHKHFFIINPPLLFRIRLFTAYGYGNFATTAQHPLRNEVDFNNSWSLVVLSLVLGQEENPVYYA